MRILGIILFVLFLIAMLWLGVGIRYGDEGLTVWVKVGFLRFQVYPMKKKKPKKPKKPKAAKPKQAQKPKKPKPAKPKKKPDIWGLAGVGIRAAGRLRRKITVTLLILRYTAASRDPYNTAMQYGHVSAAVGVLTPMIENSFNIRSREIAVNADFELEVPKIQCELRLGLFLWQIIYISGAVLIDYMKLQ